VAFDAMRRNVREDAWGAGLVGIFIAKARNSGESSKRKTIGNPGRGAEKGMTEKWQTKKWASGNVF
jgi:hypothetical protein